MIVNTCPFFGSAGLFLFPEQAEKRLLKISTSFIHIGSDEKEKTIPICPIILLQEPHLIWEKITAMEILSTVLLKAPGAPVKQALIDAGIGNDIICIYENEILQPFFSIIAKNANTEQQTEFIRIIRETMEQLAESGLKEKSLLAAIKTWNSVTGKVISGIFRKD